MKKITCILGLLFVCYTGFSQIGEQGEVDIDRIEIDSSVFRKDLGKAKKKVDFGVDLGMSYTFASGGLGGPSISFSPHVYYPLGKKFGLVAGVTVESGQMVYPVFSEKGLGYELLPMTRMFVYAGGNYKVNEKTTVAGTVYKQIMDVPNMNRNGSPQPDFNYEGMSMSINYKLTKNITIGAQIHVESPHSIWDNGLYPSDMGRGFPGIW